MKPPVAGERIVLKEAIWDREGGWHDVWVTLDETSVVMVDMNTGEIIDVAHGMDTAGSMTLEGYLPLAVDASWQSRLHAEALATADCWGLRGPHLDEWKAVSLQIMTSVTEGDDDGDGS